jgi:ornithine cyclodeaminase
MALIGNGAQSEFQAIAFRGMLGIEQLRLYDVDAAASAKLERNLRLLPDFADVEIVRARSASEACKGADIITTVTADKKNAVILTPPMVRAGQHINAVGGDCPGKTELHADVLHMPGVRVVVEYEPQSRIEGEIQQMDADYPVTEFAALVSGAAAGRSSASDITIFDSVGFALEDYSALRFLHKLLEEDCANGRQIDLVPQLADPKDLYGGTLGGSPRARMRLTG